MNDYDSVREQALSLGDGETMQGECPRCGRTDSFYVTRDGNALLFTDHSVNCGFHGRITSRPGEQFDEVATPVKKKKVFKGELTKLNHDEQLFLYRKFKLGKSATKHMRYCEDDGRVYFPQYDMMGNIAGYIARYYPETAYGKKQYGGKALWRNVTGADPHLYFPTLEVLNAVSVAKKAVLVEDYVSAMRINYQLGVPTCCIQGTALLTGHIKTLLALGVTDVVLLLDGDAITKAVKLKRSVSLAFNVKLCVLNTNDPDPKDMGKDELEGKLGHLVRWYEGE